MVVVVHIIIFSQLSSEFEIPSPVVPASHFVLCTSIHYFRGFNFLNYIYFQTRNENERSILDLFELHYSSLFHLNRIFDMVIVTSAVMRHN